MNGYLNCFSSRRCARNNGDVASGNVVVDGEEINERFVGLAVDGWGGEADFDGISVHADDFGLGGARDDMDGKAGHGAI